MLNQKNKYVVILGVTISLLWGCDSMLQNEHDLEDAILLNAEIVDERLVFESRERLNHQVQILRDMSRDSFEETLSSAYYSGFVPVVPVVNESDQATIDLLEIKMEENSWRAKSVDDEESQFEFEDIISDESFASLINTNGEIQVSDSIYKYTELGLFFVHEDNLNALYSFLESTDTYGKIVSGTKSKSITSTIELCEGPILLSLENDISYFGVTEECRPVPGPPNNPPSNPPPSGGGSDPVQEFILGLENCDTNNGAFSFVFGTSKYCTDKFNDSNYRMKTRYWNQNYLLGRSIGVSTKHQRKRLGIWWNIKTWEVRLGINQVYFEYEVPNLALESTPKEIFYYNNNSYTSAGNYLSNKPLTVPFDTDLVLQVDLTRYGLSSTEITPDDVFELAQETLIPLAKDFLESNFSTDLKGFTIFGLSDRKIVYSLVNESRSKSDAREIEKIFDFQFQIGVKFGTTGNSGFQFQTILLPDLYSYDKVRIDVYGIGRRNSEWAGSRLSYSD